MERDVGVVFILCLKPRFVFVATAYEPQAQVGDVFLCQGVRFEEVVHAFHFCDATNKDDGGHVVFFGRARERGNGDRFGNDGNISCGNADTLEIALGGVGDSDERRVFIRKIEVRLEGVADATDGKGVHSEPYFARYLMIEGNHYRSGDDVATKWRVTTK